MPPTLETAPKYAWLQHVTKGVAVIASTGAAIASIVTALHSNGVIGKGSSAASAANTAAAWVRLTPAVDTATAIGDTVAFAATAADQNGSILGGMTPVWTSGDSTIATVAANGTVIARGPGVTTIAVVVGKRVASAHVVVRQQVAGIAITTPAAAVREGDTLLVLPEGHQVALRARVHDARGHTVQGRSARWAVDDTTVAAVDLQGQLTAGIAGRGVVRATVDGMSALMPLAVVALPAAIGVVDGSGQRALAGRRLPREIVVRAITRRGAPAAGRLVTFRVAAAGGSAEPLTATTDADGRARTQWTLGERPGAQSLQATVEQVDSAAVVEAEADPLAGNARIAAVVPALRARAGATLQDSVAVRLTDSTGYPLAGVPVRWNAVHGSVQAVDLRTDSGGVARARWTLAPATGTQRLRALVGTPDGPIAPGEILATAVAGPAAAIAVVRGDRQQAGAGRALASPIVLRVVDAGGNGVPGVPVVLTLSGGAVADSTPATDSLGFVRVRWVLG
ncbi:MAG: Ig domain protein group 1 domain protein, partial [Gemmatimonadetes bacterium]|nr:Ig domain protein group 1 domain protein [Gemmatimonadota bacterium]